MVNTFFGNAQCSPRLRDEVFLSRYVKGVTCFDQRYTKGVAFLSGPWGGGGGVVEEGSSPYKTF